MTACLSIQFGENDTACPGDPQATPNIPNVPVEELERLVKDSASQQRHQRNLSSKGGCFRCKSSERSNDLRMSETESAKSIAELKTSNTISSEPHSAHARKVPNRVFCFFHSFFVSKIGSCGRAPARSCPRHKATHQHHSTSAQPLTNKRKPTTTTATNNNAHQQQTTNTQSPRRATTPATGTTATTRNTMQQQQQLFHSVCVPERTSPASMPAP